MPARVPVACGFPLLLLKAKKNRTRARARARNRLWYPLNSYEKSSKKPGGQNGHQGFRLEKSENPDEIIDIKIDKTTLPRGKYQDIGYEASSSY